MGFREGDMDEFYECESHYCYDIAWEYQPVLRALKVILSTSSNGWNAATAPSLFSHREPCQEGLG